MSPFSATRAYRGLFLIAFSSLALQVALVRLLSVTTWYHLAFFAISTAMLGMTSGAVQVYLRAEEYSGDRLPDAVRRACLGYAIGMLPVLLVLCLVPLGIHRGSMTLFAFLMTTVAAALPFHFAGTAIAALLTRQASLPIGRLYASDLAGASLGCLFVLGGLELFDAPSVILLSGGIGALAASCFPRKADAGAARRPETWLAVLLLAGGVVNSLGPEGIRPLVVKGRQIEPATDYLIEKWNSFSRIAVYPRKTAAPHYWGPSPMAPDTRIEQHWMNIDGEAATIVGRFNAPEDIEYLRYDVTNAAYLLGRKGSACIIGVGGGRDLQSAWLFGHRPVTGVEINPVFVGLLRNEFRDFAGLDRPEVRLVTAEARGWLSRNPGNHAVIQMSLIDTWAATGAGAFSLSENALYTVEAWNVFFNRLQDDGVFTVSRWHAPGKVGETGRMLSLAVATLLRERVEDPARHLALLTSGRISTLVMARAPLTQTDLATLAAGADSLGFTVTLLPGRAAADPLLGRIAASRTPSELQAAIRDEALDYSPTTDENPYFFNMLRLGNLGEAFAAREGVLRGNLSATLTLLGLLASLLIVALATVALPLLLGRRSEQGRARWPGMLYFSLIGCGFMLTEIALIQRLTVFLSHPIYALGILLFTLIASAGAGSFLSDKLPVARAPWMFAPPVVVAIALLALPSLLGGLLEALVTAPLSVKIPVSVAVIFPVGLLLGLFFPAGMRLARASGSGDTPWYWALNGIFGVVCSALAVLISIYAGISTNFRLAALCYLALPIAQAALRARAR